MSSVTSREKKEITFNLLKGRSCDNCLYHQRLFSQIMTSDSFGMEIREDEYCHFNDTHNLTRLRFCKGWKR